ncbi:MAG: GNAT family N-acetyltransferase [Clostridia bacterium]|nr:GNAT family N-acetyltransferase [Clostridia bacterium]
MEIIDFNKEMAPQAQELLWNCYLEERAHAAALPEEPRIPPLEGLAQNGLGVAAVEDGKLLGFLGAYGPWKPVFCTPDVSGVFSPLHAHAVQREDRVRLWRRLYQAAAEKWAQAGAASHAITLFAHDCGAREALYMYGFGVRCLDMMRPMKGIAAGGGWTCSELPHARHGELTPLRRELAAHLAQSPSFMHHEPEQLEAWLRRKAGAGSRVFVAERNGRIAAYIEADGEGENFLTGASGTANICGAYCLPAYRGMGAAQAALNAMISALKDEGYVRLGVDCESMNPTALGFWSKYFDIYTHSVVRRIDENAVLYRVQGGI